MTIKANFEEFKPPGIIKIDNGYVSVTLVRFITFKKKTIQANGKVLLSLCVENTLPSGLFMYPIQKKPPNTYLKSKQKRKKRPNFYFENNIASLRVRVCGSIVSPKLPQQQYF